MAIRPVFKAILLDIGKISAFGFEKNRKLKKCGF